jgi:hypothetical protein
MSTRTRRGPRAAAATVELVPAVLQWAERARPRELEAIERRVSLFRAAADVWWSAALPLEADRAVSPMRTGATRGNLGPLAMAARDAFRIDDAAPPSEHLLVREIAPRELVSLVTGETEAWIEQCPWNPYRGSGCRRS